MAMVSSNPTQAAGSEGEMALTSIGASQSDAEFPKARSCVQIAAMARADSRSFYTGWLLDERDRTALLARFPPRYPEVVAHHVTLKFGDAEARPPRATKGHVVGQADDGDGVEALIVAIDGTTDRPDGSTFHITWSLGPGREARESNAVISQHGWRRFADPVPVRLKPKAAT